MSRKKVCVPFFIELQGKDGYILVEKKQVVPEMTHLPDMEKAFEKAMELAK